MQMWRSGWAQIPAAPIQPDNTKGENSKAISSTRSFVSRSPSYDYAIQFEDANIYAPY